MKRAPINLYEKQVVAWTSKRAFLSKFKRYWGTTVVDGIEVLIPKTYVYPSMSDSTRQLLKMLNILYQVTSQDYKGVNNAWLFLNPAKTGTVAADTATISRQLTEYLNELRASVPQGSPIVQDEYKFKFTVTVTAPTGTVTPASINTYLNTHEVTFSNIFAFVQFLLTPVEFTDISTGRITKSKYDPITDSTMTVYVPTAVCTFELAPKDFDLLNIPTKLKSYLDISITGKRNIDNLSNYDKNILNIHQKSLSMFIADNNPAIWYVDALGNSYLRASFLSDTSFPIETRIETIMKAVDFDYAEKEADLWSKLAVALLVVAAVVLALPSGGLSLTALAIVVVTVAVTLSLAALLMYSWGDYGGANFANTTNKQISPFVQIAQLILLISTGLDLSKASQAAATQAAEQGTKEAVKRAIQQLINNIDYNTVFKTIDIVARLWNENRLNEIRKKNKQLEQEAQEAQEFVEASKQNDLIQQFINTYPQQLKADWSIYSEVFDRPYEPVYPKLHIGNIQATTVSAFNRIT